MANHPRADSLPKRSSSFARTALGRSAGIPKLLPSSVQNGVKSGKPLHALLHFFSYLRYVLIVWAALAAVRQRSVDAAEIISLELDIGLAAIVTWSKHIFKPDVGIHSTIAPEYSSQTRQGSGHLHHHVVRPLLDLVQDRLTPGIIFQAEMAQLKRAECATYSIRIFGGKSVLIAKLGNIFGFCNAN